MSCVTFNLALKKIKHLKLTIATLQKILCNIQIKSATYENKPLHQTVNVWETSQMADATFTNYR